MMHGLAKAPMSTKRAGFMLGLMTLIYVLNYIDRQIITILQEPIKHEFGLADWQLGVLTGAAISLFYTAASLPIARWIDRGVNRVKLIASITALWSLLTALCGLSQSFIQFVIGRMGVGVAEAGFAPAAHSLLSDMFPERRRPMAMALLALGIPSGIMLGLSIGGTVAQWYNWRVALFIVGLPGLLVALIYYLVAREPERGASEHYPIATADGPEGLIAAMKILVRRPAYVQVLLATGTSALVSTGMLAWTPSFLIRAHGLTLQEAGIGLGIVTGIAGLLGTSLGGWQATKFGAKGMYAMLPIPIVALGLTIPTFITTLFIADGTTALWVSIIPISMTYVWSAPSIALVQNLAPVRIRATASAIYMIIANVVGMAAGPMFTGILSDILTRRLGSEAEGLRWAMTITAALMVWAMVHWTLAMRKLRAAQDRGELVVAA
ncbi:spinster family MFS transporter [Sphingomonas montanisoli]|uniref:MFS transporter n=1 Tax=Sphingomonas montanisoli TaxID=2606412 RepID=A0A5D9CDK3_9SPHN|nr:MFS transporter [Sphingomonas montanisoli]TZG29407.1 MFS transporter [Sphingomonas montanisoli]